MKALEIFSLVISIAALILFAIAGIYSLSKFFDDPNNPEWLIAALLAMIAIAV